MDYEGVPKSTYYYRRKHPQTDISRSEASEILGMTPESVSRAKKRLALATFKAVVDYYQRREAEELSYAVIPPDGVIRLLPPGRLALNGSEPENMGG